jgi:single-strand DNA-binding protein
MASYNKIVLVGRLTRDPELRYTAGGLAVTKFAVAVDRRFKNQQGERVTDFFDCSAFRQTAEFVANYVSKGRLVLVEGSIEFNESTAQDGQKRRYTNVIVDNVQTLDSQRDAGAGGDMGGGNAGAGGYNRNAGGGAPAGGDDGGYFPDEDAAPAPRGGAGAGAAGAGAAGAGGAGASGGSGRPAPQAQRPQAGPPAARRAPEPAYPEDDFDDSDPFADQ